AIHFTLVDAIHHGVAGDASRALNALDGATWIAWTRGLGLMLIGFGAAALRGSVVLSRALTLVALVLGVALFFPVVDFFALVLSLLWILTASVVLAGRR